MGESEAPLLKGGLGGLDTLHIISHGSPGSLKLGNTTLNPENLEQYQDQLQQWQTALSENADINIYGCNVAEGVTGQAFIQQLANLTKADIAASNDLTGNGGDWDLEIVTGNIESEIAVNAQTAEDYEYSLANFDVTVATDTGDDTVANSLSWAIRQANLNAGADTITLGTDVTVTAVMKNLINSDISFIGNNRTVSGGNSFRPFFVKSGTVNFSDLTITQGQAKGGNSGGDSGGGGAGMGGGLFIYNGTVGLNNVTFSNNSAIGGNNSGGSGRGGGGMFGNSGFDAYASQSGGGGLFASATTNIGGYGGNGNYGGGVSAFGGGGNGQYVSGSGGFGGGGGGANWGGGAAGAGGFGGGGGGMGGYTGGNGGYGGGGGRGPSGIGGFGAGNSRGGGAGLGGAIFIRQGSLSLNNATFTSNTSTGGTGNNNGQGKGGAIFAMQSLTNTNGNNQGMPTALPTVSVVGYLRTSNNAAANDASTNADNDDLYWTNTNTAPTLANTVVTLNTVLEDAAAPSGAVGTLISSIAAIGTGQNNITDPDTGAVAGVAITAADTTNGSWFYSTDGGTNWNALGTVSNTSARLLAADANTRIYFQPNADYNGTVTNAITFRAWDQVVGTNGATADTTINIGISTATDTADITVTAVNDQPSFSNAGNQTLAAWANTAQTVANWANTFVFGPANESSQAVQDFIVNVTAGNTLFTSLPDIANDGTLTYTPNGTPGTATISVQLRDNGGTANSGADTSTAASFTITIPPPTVNLSISPTTGTEAGTTAITVTATAAGPVVGNQTVDLALTGTATAADFAGTIPTQITIANGTSSGQVTFTIADDQLDELDETANLTISNPSAGILLGTTTGSFTITDNDTAGFDILPISGNTSEDGTPATFDIRLTSQPTADVTIGLSSSNTAEGTVSPATLTFTPANWNAYQTVTITGQDDGAVIDGDIAYQIITAPDTTTTDANYNNLDPADVAVTNTDNDTPGVTITQSASSTEVTEGGATDTYTVKLNTLPSGNVAVTVTADAQAEVSLDGTNFAPTQTLTFTNANGTTPQTVIVRAVDDTLAEDDHTSSITHAITTSADANYPTTMAIGGVNANITDNDISYTLTGSSATIAEGNSGTQQINFTIERTGAINEASTVDFSFGGTAANTIDYNLVSITGTGVTTAGSTISFAANATQASVTVEIVGDQIDETDETLELTLSNATATGTSSIIGSPVTTTITDDDTAGVTITPTSGLTTTEAGGTATFTVVLDTQPTSDVTMAVASSNTAEGTVALSSLTFTAANWNQPQTVTITGVDDNIDDGDIGYNITTTASSNDTNYDGITIATVAVTNTDKDTAGVTITPTSGLTTTEAGGTATFTVVLDTQPTSDVTIGLSSSDTSEGNIDKTSLTFTAANWNTPQTVTVTGADDNIGDGSIAYNIITTASSNDTNYDSLAVDDVAVTNSDNEISSLVVPPTTEAEPTATPEITTPVVADDCPPMPAQPIVSFEVSATIDGTNNDDILIGDNNANAIKGYTGNDFILGLASSDIIIGGVGENNTSADNDIIFGNGGNDLIQGSSGNDIIFGGQDNDIAHGGQGDDLLWGDRGSDTLMGDNGNDVIYGGPGDPSLSDVDLGDAIYGGLGNDILLGNQGNDSISGGDGSDLLYGGRDNDLLHGDAGNDFLYGDKGNDTLCAGDGDDTLYGGTGSDTGVGQNGEKDLLHGGAGNDIIFGSEGDDTLQGDIGDDTLYGGKDNDIILGGDGSDILSGDNGNDTLTGGGGSDTFRLLANAGTDIITDFTDGEDMIGLAGGLTFSELSIFATTDGFAAISAGSETLAILNGINVSLITSDDFMSVG